MLCPGCGSEKATTRELKRYHYVESGLPNIWLFGGVQRSTCANCGQTYTLVRREGQLLQLIVSRLLQKPAALTGSEMKFLRKECRLTQAELAKRLHVARETVAQRELGRDITVESDVYVRGVVLATFWRLLQNKNNRYLTAAQMKHLDTFRCHFTEWLLQTQGKAPKTLSLVHDRDWRLKAA